MNHTQPGGEIKATVHEAAGKAVFEVIDTGDGIDEKDLPFIFDRFYRADRSRNRRSGGTGLGLAIAKSIVQLHGGDIAAKSAPGKGTTITFSLPYTTDYTEHTLFHL